MYHNLLPVTLITKKMEEILALVVLVFLKKYFITDRQTHLWEQKGWMVIAAVNVVF